jgi:hypothetical protein
MAEVLSGLGSLFGGGNSLQQMQQQFGMIKPGEQANPMLKTPLMLSPENYNRMEDAKKQAQQFDTNKALLNSVNQQAQLNLKNAMPMMQMSPMRQPTQMQQINLMDLLKNIGGGY